MGAFLVFLACGALGLVLAGNLVRRQEILRELQVALQLLETEIAYAAMPLPEAFLRVAQKCRFPLRRLFAVAGRALEERRGIAADEAWQAGLAELRAVAPLEEEDLAVLVDLGRGLGWGDKEDQVRKLELARTQLRHLEQRAAEARSRQARIWQALGFLGGAAVIVLLYW
ncbi:MAG: stage III sporulation protein AB [Clostridia bacterium]|jgi:stage III sporulation protein AB|nr:stage III sporulation protein AB [Clostridia bacterium]MDH7572651.1 stage III sporulation protein AB [Clostridia bacterium]